MIFNADSIQLLQRNYTTYKIMSQIFGIHKPAHHEKTTWQLYNLRKNQVKLTAPNLATCRG